MHIPRYKTAISRSNFSRPFQIALSTRLISKDTSIFDYGCGKGDDLQALNSLGYKASGWDPSFNPNEKPKKADAINLGFVINVIENPSERIEVIRKAFRLAKKVLMVSSRLTFELNKSKCHPHGDGYFTQKKTFQKFYTQDELRDLLHDTLKIEPIPAAPGIFFVFKDDLLKSSFESSRFRRRIYPNFKINANEVFDKNKPLLQPIVDFLMERGRLPDDLEITCEKKLKEKFGNIRRAFGVIRQVLNEDDWSKVQEERTEDLAIYLGLAKFSGRPPISKLGKDIQLDVKAFFGSYKEACKQADELLFSVGDQTLVNKACQQAPCGKLTHDALYIHESSLPKLSPVIRTYEGCARNYMGDVEGANIIKLHRLKPKVSYLSYPKFDSDPHPSLTGALVVPLRSFDVKYYNYSNSDNPPILHRKEEFVPSDHPSREKFSKLTKQEERAGLFENTRIIGTRERWKEVLETQGVCLRGHRLTKIK